MKTFARQHLLLLAALATLAARSGTGQVVTKDIGNFADGQWVASMWNAASGSIKGGTEVETTVQYTGRGFQHFALDPRQALVIPGRCRRIHLRFKMDDGYGLTLRFNDGWGRGDAAGKKFEWGLPGKAPGQWQEVVFNVPADWVMPLQIGGVTTHNWGREQTKADFRFTLGGLKVETDLSDVDPATGKLRSWSPEPNPRKPAEALKECPAVPLLQAHIQATELANVFAGADPAIHVILNNWKPGTASGIYSYKLFANDNTLISTGEKAVSAESFSDTLLPLPVPKFGRYRLDSSLKLTDNPEIRDSMVFAKIPAPRTLTAAEKEASPYGLNIHSGKLSGDLVGYLPPFIKAGMVWFRDYAWDYGWLIRARGDDGKFGGWPYYNKVGRSAKELDIMLMPCMQNTIRAPLETGGKVTVNPPDREWASNLVLVMNAFPEFRYWELDNEYNLRDDRKKLEIQVDWKNYQLYHKRFAEVAEALSGGEAVAVEEGRAGCHPEKIEACVRSGSFDKIKVVNSHNYCGSEPPETSGENMNTGGGGDSGSAIARTYFDNLRDAKKAGCSDGKYRQHWVTEFAWDTLAGHIVTPYLQAAYLPRGWMVALVAGTEKCFWFGDTDSAHPAMFFDGCGLLGPGPRNEPKLSLCSLAGLTHILPSPTFVGTLDAGPGSYGCLFSQSGKLVASLWMIASDDGIKVDLKADTLYDFLGNPLPAGKPKLNNTPLYAVGISKDSIWYAQTAYELDSRHVLAGAIGDTVTAAVEIHNNRNKPLTGDLSISLPSGWQNDVGVKTITVKPGETNRVEMPFVIPAKTELGVRPLTIQVAEQGKPVKAMAFTLQVRDPLGLTVSPLGNKPGRRDIRMTVANLSASPRSGEVALKLPGSWTAEPMRAAVATLQPGEKRDLPFVVDWSKGLKEGESASAIFATTGNSQITKSLVAGVGTLHRAKGKLEMDGNLSDWSDRNRLPDSMISTTMGNAGAQFWMAWAPEGLYVAVKVEDSMIDVLDPRSFWGGSDCLELCLDMADNKTPRQYVPGDHQFWMMPLAAQNRVYVGQWKRNEEIPATLYDIPDIRSSARALGTGYVMEFLLPAAHLQKYQPKAGTRIGLNFTLTIKGRKFDREAFWPESKSVGIITVPQSWGSIELAE